MKTYSRFLIAAFAGSVLCTLLVNPSGEGFVRGYNVVFTLLITSAIVWAMTLPAIAFVVWRWVRSRDLRGTLRQERRTAVLALVGMALPVLNALIVRIKSALDYR